MELNQLARQIDPFLAGAALQMDSTSPAIASPDATCIFGFRFHPMTGPELLLQAEDIAQIVITSLQLPRTAEVTNLEIRPPTLLRI